MKTRSTKSSKITKSPQNPKRTRRRHDLDEDVPTCYSPALREIEQRIGRGFWGNNTTGHIYDKDQ